MILSCLLLLFLPVSSFAQFLGNVTDGYRIGNEIYLRELYENSSHQDPYVGNAVYDFIGRRSDVLSSVQALGVDPEILARKISDAEYLKSGLGFFLMDIIGSYSWSFSNQVRLAPDEAPFFVLPPEIVRVPLALRTHLKVFIHEDNFKLLSPVQKVALVLNVAISSLIKLQGVRCESAICMQSSFSAGAINAILFSKQGAACSVALMGSCLGEAFSSALNVDWENNYSFRSQVTLWPVGAEGFIKNANDQDFSSHRIARTSEILSAQFCQMIFADKDLRKEVTLEMYRPPYALTFLKYYAENSYKLSAIQIASRIVPRQSLCFATVPLYNLQYCETSLKNFMRAWFSPQAMGGYGPDCNLPEEL